MTAQCLLLLSVVILSLMYVSEIWECNRSQARVYITDSLQGVKKILGCSSKMCNEAAWGDMGLERRDRAKLKWCYKVCSMPEVPQAAA